MALGFHLHPEGIFDNSPAHDFNRGLAMENSLSPEWRAEITRIHFSCPFGTNPLRPLAPRHLPPGTLLFAMVLEFTKMNGAGNDFVLIDNRAQTLHLSPA